MTDVKLGILRLLPSVKGRVWRFRARGSCVYWKLCLCVVSVSNSLPVNVVVLQRNLSSVSPSLRESVENVEFTRTELRAYVAAYNKNTSRYMHLGRFVRAAH